jgi:ribosomal protein L5
MVVQISFKDFLFKSSSFISFLLFFIEFITYQKTKFGFSKKDVSYWRLRKKDTVSVYLTIQGKSILFFIEKLVLFYFSKTIPIDQSFFYIDKNYIFCKLSNLFVINELEYESIKIQSSKLSLSNFKVAVIFIFDTEDPKRKVNCLRSLQIPI